jgi:Metallo-beta-lactamase superfamily
MPAAPVLTIHRAADEIGGNCIELAHDGHRLLLDAGSPLAGDGATDPQRAIPRTLDTSAAVAGLVISHPHQDHWGLLHTLPASWPVWGGAASEVLIRMTASLSGAVVEQRFQPYRPHEPFAIGPFMITPYLTDHSAFDAHMLLVDVAGKRVLCGAFARLNEAGEGAGAASAAANGDGRKDDRDDCIGGEILGSRGLHRGVRRRQRCRRGRSFRRDRIRYATPSRPELRLPPPARRPADRRRPPPPVRPPSGLGAPFPRTVRAARVDRDADLAKHHDLLTAHAPRKPTVHGRRSLRSGWTSGPTAATLTVGERVSARLPRGLGC